MTAKELLTVLQKYENENVNLSTLDITFYVKCYASDLNSYEVKIENYCCDVCSNTFTLYGS